MDNWAPKWLRREFIRDEKLDPDVPMWELRQNFVARGESTTNRRVACFQLDGVPIAKRFYWLVFEAQDVDICAQDPGHEVDLWIFANMRTHIEIWLGHIPMAKALGLGQLRLDGPSSEIKAFHKWFCLSHFAEDGQRLTAAS